MGGLLEKDTGVLVGSTVVITGTNATKIKPDFQKCKPRLFSPGYFFALLTKIKLLFQIKILPGLFGLIVTMMPPRVPKMGIIPFV
jgi:hypothetical protein